MNEVTYDIRQGIDWRLAMKGRWQWIGFVVLMGKLLLAPYLVYSGSLRKKCLWRAVSCGRAWTPPKSRRCETFLAGIFQLAKFNWQDCTYHWHDKVPPPPSKAYCAKKCRTKVRREWKACCIRGWLLNQKAARHLLLWWSLKGIKLVWTSGG